MIPASSKAFLVTNLMSGTRYDLCVVAAWDDSATTLMATDTVGCTSFYTLDSYSQCHSSTQLLGGTMILVVGGVIVVTLLVFMVILMVFHKTAGAEAPVEKETNISDTYSQTSGGYHGQNALLTPWAQALPQSEPKGTAKVTLKEEVVKFKCGSLQSTITSSSSSLDSGDSYNPNNTIANIWRSSPSKPRTQLDHLLGAFTSQDLGSTSSSAKTKLHIDREPLLDPSLDCSLSRLLMLPLDSRPKRSLTFDMGDARPRGTQMCNKPHKISSIWTKRSLSVNGILLQCEEEDTGESKGTANNADWMMESTV